MGQHKVLGFVADVHISGNFKLPLGSGLGAGLSGTEILLVLGLGVERRVNALDTYLYHCIIAYGGFLLGGNINGQHHIVRGDIALKIRAGGVSVHKFG